MSDLLEKKLTLYAQNNLNVMLIGHIGIGKTTIVKKIANELSLSFKYYSSSTLDPFADLIGIPVPNTEKKHIEYYRPQDLEQAEFVFFDELNRVTNPRILNTILEIVQFKSINGVPLKNLKMIWAAINPPGSDYQIEDLDRALIDRFHVYIKMKACMNLPYLETKMNKDVAKVVKDWWEFDLEDEQRKNLSPRRMEYVGLLIDKNLPWRDSFPQEYIFPLESLKRRIEIMQGTVMDLAFNKENILDNISKLCKKIETEPKIAISLADCMVYFDANELFASRLLLEKMPQELIYRIANKKFTSIHRKLFNLFTTDQEVDPVYYPKIFKAFKFDERSLEDPLIPMLNKTLTQPVKLGVNIHKKPSE